MANETTSVNKALATVLMTTGQIGQIMAAALGLFSLFKQARAAWQAAHPSVPDPFLTDADLIAGLTGSSEDLIALADRLIAKYQEPEPAPADPVIPV
jgi:hypothetical protein